jgi:hypothetical protein
VTDESEGKVEDAVGDIDLRGMVSVYGSGIRAPLLQTNDARLIQIRDNNGDLMAMMFKLTNSMWAFSTSSDADWEDHKKRLEIDDSKV